MLPDGAFTVLLLLVGGVSAVPVPPPRNVHVSCQNAKVSVSWDYSKQQPHTIFRINISGSSENWEVSRTTDHHFDLSHFVWKSEENYKDFLYVTVTAIQGDSQSEGVQSNSFSFNYLKTVDTQCSLDFPPVDVKEDESGATVSFPNPVHFYKELEQTVNPDAVPVFQYIVSSVKNHTAYIRQFEENCMERVDTCKLDVPFPDGVKKCVRLKGTLFDSNFVNQLVVRETAEICAHVSAEVDVVMVTVILFCVLVFIIIVVVVYICKSNAWTMHVHKKDPEALRLDHWQENGCCYPVHNEVFSKVYVQKWSSVSSEDDRDSKAGSDQPLSDSYLYPDRRLSESSNQELEDAEMIPEGSGTDNDSADDSVKTECVSLGSEEDEQESVSPYDSPQAVMLDLGDGDMVTGYKG
ncbi:interferon gamma receptor 1 isoform X1 [Amphiprion ocellaris]|uniref:Fibronectin type-III domain-containing protein n=1 Tax=Amphiprion ocellaris TaxID=80972 RepID=A0A3Q1B2D1_AMPOC|nr:interferon gamma receptor 1 isoform X1 [Amphiprion ocellaris]